MAIELAEPSRNASLPPHVAAKVLAAGAAGPSASMVSWLAVNCAPATEDLVVTFARSTATATPP